MCAFFPRSNPRPLNYDEWHGLWLNLPRIERKYAILTARGIEYSLTTGELERAYFDAVCDWEEQVDEVEFRNNSERAKLAARQQRGKKSFMG